MIQSGLFFVNRETRVLRKHFSLFSRSILVPGHLRTARIATGKRRDKKFATRPNGERSAHSPPGILPHPAFFSGPQLAPPLVSDLAAPPKKGKGPRFARPKAVGGLKAVTLAAARPFSRGREGEKRAKAAAKPGKDTRAELGSRLGRGENWSRMTGKSLLAKAALLHTWASQGEASFFLSPYASSRPLS